MGRIVAAIFPGKTERTAHRNVHRFFKSFWKEALAGGDISDNPYQFDVVQPDKSMRMDNRNPDVSHQRNYVDLPTQADILRFMKDLWPKVYNSPDSPIRANPGMEVFDLNLTTEKLAQSGYPGIPLRGLNRLQHLELGDVWQARTAEFVLAKASAEAPLTLFGVGHYICTAVLIRAVDSSGNAWIGHAHLDPGPLIDHSTERGNKGKAFDQFVRVLTYLQSKNFDRVQIQVVLPNPRPFGMIQASGIENTVQEFGFQALPTQIHKGNDDVVNTLNTATWWSWSTAALKSIVRDPHVSAWPPAPLQIRHDDHQDGFTKDGINQGNPHITDEPRGKKPLHLRRILGAA